MRLIILIPAYNEEETIASLLEGIPESFPGVDDVITLVVDDGSTDHTAAQAKETGAIVVSHTHNRGVGSAFNTGLTTALEMGADILVNIDADEQFSPQEISLLIKPILAGRADFVAGDRFTQPDGRYEKPEAMPAVKFWGNKQMSRLISMLAGQNFNDVSCGFRAYSKEAMLRLNLTGKFTYTQETFLDLASKDLMIETIPVNVKYYDERRSRVAGNVLQYLYHTLNIILRAYRDYRPLKFFVILGTLPFVTGSICGLFTLIHYINTGAITPYKSVGLIGLYLVSIAFILWIVGILADMFVRIRLYQEKILYYEKKRRYG